MNFTTANRVILGLAALGMLLAIHIWIQKQQHFEDGCWGFGGVSSSDTCNSPEFQKLDRFVGVPLPILGYAYYTFIAAVSCILSTSRSRAPAFGTVRSLVIQIGLLVSLYLTAQQAFVIHKYCPLCIASAILTLIISTIDWMSRKPTGEPSDNPIMVHSTFVVFSIGLPVILFMPGNRATGSEISAAAPLRIQPPLELPLADLISNGTSLGKGSVSILAFLDPNCPHCVTAYGKLTELARADRITLNLLPMVLWEKSLIQVRYLEVAKRHGKYFEMWESQFARMKPSGLNNAELEELARKHKIGDELLDRELIESTEGITSLQLRLRALGIKSSPTIYVDGRLLAGSEQSGDGIERAVQSIINARKK